MFPQVRDLLSRAELAELRNELEAACGKRSKASIMTATEPYVPVPRKSGLRLTLIDLRTGRRAQVGNQLPLD
jgi:hypothetical protein